jgi:hypothetical protein
MQTKQRYKVPAARRGLIAWLCLLFLTALLLFLIIYVAPLGLRLPGYRQMDLFIAENDLKATAIYYTDLEEFTRAERSIRDGMRFAPAARTSGGPSVHP